MCVEESGSDSPPIETDRGSTTSWTLKLRHSLSTGTKQWLQPDGLPQVVGTRSIRKLPPLPRQWGYGPVLPFPLIQASTVPAAPSAQTQTIHRGWTAPQAAGVIDTDFKRGFIKTEVDRLCKSSGVGGTRWHCH